MTQDGLDGPLVVPIVHYDGGNSKRAGHVLHGSVVYQR